MTTAKNHIRKPAWLKVAIGGTRCGKVGRILEKNDLHTVCEQAGCPNKGACFKNGTATFMLLGPQCTRDCAFCNVVHGAPAPVNPAEPENVARAAAELDLRHVVVTSVTRDDLADGGAGHFAATVHALRRYLPSVVIEVLIPDFQGDPTALQKVIDAKPTIINHNVETVPALYPAVRSGAVFDRSVRLLHHIKTQAPDLFTKSGFMLGLGEDEAQVTALLKTLRDAQCDIVTIGQYLQPSPAHYPVQAYIPPPQFAYYAQLAHDMGVPCVTSGPLVRSSYHAAEDFQRLVQTARANGPSHTPKPPIM